MVYDDETGAWSKNRDYTGMNDTTIPILIENGLKDDLPADAEIPADLAVAAFIDYFNLNARSKKIFWDDEAK